VLTKNFSYISVVPAFKEQEVLNSTAEFNRTVSTTKEHADGNSQSDGYQFQPSDSA